MATTKFHSNVGDIVPWQAQYSFPSQATRSQKQTVKLVPKNGSDFGPVNNRIRLEFPSDGYLNLLNSVLKFDLQLDPGFFPIQVPSAGITSGTANNQKYVDLDLSSFTNQQAPAGSGLASRDITKYTQTSNGLDGMLLVMYFSGESATNSVTARITTSTWDAGNGLMRCFYKNLSSYTPDLNEVSNVRVIFPMRLGRHGGHSLIKRLRVLYGGMVLEDIQEYSTLSRILYDTSVGDDYLSSAGNLLEGSSATTFRDSAPIADPLNSRNIVSDFGLDCFSAPNCRRQIVLNAMSGILNAKKLLPLKWMAAQFAVEIELNTPAAAFTFPSRIGPSKTIPTTASYLVNNVQYIAEMLDFDSTFDYAFLTGLKTSGVPIKYSSWHWHTHRLEKLTQAQIHERARSIKAAFSVIKDSVPKGEVDSDIFYHDAGKSWRGSSAQGIVVDNEDICDVVEYQYRIGGKYHPAQPVDCENGGAEAFLELSKTINSLGDYTFSANIAPTEWSQHYNYSGTGAANKFIMAMEFENRDVFPDTISGINGEEQSDLNLSVQLRAQPPAGNSKHLETFVNYDALLVIKDGNIVELVM